MTKILHISDIHAGSPEFDTCRNWLENKLLETLQQENITILVCSGDLSFKGQKNGYPKAISFLKKIIPNEVQTILVPGNHDICKKDEKLFFEFDLASEKITTLSSCRFSEKPCYRFCFQEVEFFLTNSAYHGDYTYGEVDITSLRKELSNSTTGTKKILITHHPFLSEQNDRYATMRNGSELLLFLAKNDFVAVLHGHQHRNSRFGYKFENSTIDVIGIRSLTLPSPGIPIGAQIIDIGGSEIQVSQIDMAKDTEATW